MNRFITTSKKFFLLVLFSLYTSFLTAAEKPTLSEYVANDVMFASESGGELSKLPKESMPEISDLTFIETDKYGDFVLQDSTGAFFYIDPIYLKYEMEKVELTIYCPETDENRTAAVTRGVDTCE
ncbi:hypothetical protein [uncultured Methylophaga sp.]|uniref:hypothetical protein n=1 Tax=uncultured Methylophaga sp. TaxID=285271 RepID=UPI00261F9BA9|nr:hypothetical protein [uncultured Methylophaga sp.]